MICLALGPACENGGGGGGKSTNKQMTQSTGDFNLGYQDGKRDADRSLMNAKGAEMWLWMKPADYRKGYDQGWAEGWRIKDLKSKQPKQKEESSLWKKDPSSQRQTSQRGALTTFQPVRLTDKPKPAATKTKLAGQP